MLLPTIVLPFLGALVLSSSASPKANALVQGKNNDALDSVNQIKQMRLRALIITCATYLSSVIIWINFDVGVSEMQFTQQVTDWTFGQLSFGVDQLSLFFILLTTITIPIVILSSFYINSHIAKTYLILMLMFEGFLIIVFSSLDLVLFYISFEAVLIPLSLLVGMFGGIRRIQAAFLLFLYTLVGSLPILLSIIKIYSITGVTHIGLLSMISPEYNHLVWLGIFLGLAVKTPIVPFHLWLKTAHSEANTATSIILAGLVLKISSYGFLRILLGIFPNESAYFSPMVIVFALISVVYTSFSCLRQTDFKQLIAYSSVSHIGIVVLGIFSNTVIGIEGGILLSIAHGFTSPALFFLLGGVVYDRYHSRTIRYYRGLSIYMPLFAIFFFIFSLANIGTPITSNWIGEFISLAGSFQNYPIVTAMASTSIFLSACYSIYLFNRICFGQWSPYLVPVIDMNRLEFHVVLPLLFFTFLVGLYPNFVLDSIHLGVSSLIYSV